MKAITWLTPLLVISAAAAQGIVTPANFAVAEADTYSANGVGNSQTPSVYLGIYEDMEGKTATLKSVSLRREGGNDFGASISVLWTANVYVSTAAKTGAAPSATFAENHGLDKTQVAAGAFVLVPATEYGGPVSPFDYTIPFDQHFSWTGGGPLCIEIQMASKSPTGQTVYLDFVGRALQNNPTVVYRKTGDGCIASAHTSKMQLNPTATSRWTTGSVTLSYSGRYMPPTTTAPSFVALLVGVRQSLGGVPLPLEIPYTAGLPGGPPSHSGSCYLHNDVLLTLYAFVSATGTTSLDLGLRVDAAYNGLNLYTTAVGVDPAANPFGVITSNGTQHHLVAPWPGAASPYGHGSVYRNGSMASPGTVQANRALVIKLGT